MEPGLGPEQRRFRPSTRGLCQSTRDGRSAGGWVLAGLGALIILAGILANLHIFFAPTSLFDTLVMLCLLAGGLGMVARSLRAQPEA